MTEAIEARAFEAMPRHARFADLVALTRGVAVRAAKARALVWKPLSDSAPDTERGTLSEDGAATDFGNVWRALERGPKTADERGVLRALWAHAVAEQPLSSPEGADEMASEVVWLAAFTPFDATGLLDKALGERGEPFWRALAERVHRIDAGESDTVSRGEALAAVAALRASTSQDAAKELGRLKARVTDPITLALLPASSDDSIELRGELDAPPRHAVVTVVLALTGILFVVGAARLAARIALAYRCPAEITLTASSVRVRSRRSILGRTVREGDVLLARSGLVRAVREVRYARAAFYAGLIALGVGSLVGVHTFVDGVRAASPSLLFWGAAVVAAGVAMDFLLSSLGATRPGQCRVVFVGKDRVAVAVTGVDAARADEALGRLARS